MARIPYTDPEAEKTYQDMSRNSSKPSVGLSNSMNLGEVNDYEDNQDVKLNRPIKKNR